MAHSLRKLPGTEEHVRDLRLVLKHCREVGIDAAYEAKQRSEDADRLRDALADLVMAHTDEALKAALIAHPELQSKAADQWLAEWEEDTSNYGADRIDAWRSLLRSCREHGVDAAMDAYAKSQSDLERSDEIFKEFMDAETAEEKRALM